MYMYQSCVTIPLTALSGREFGLVYVRTWLLYILRGTVVSRQIE